MATYQIAFSMEPQQQKNWCWSAVAVSVATYFGTVQPGGSPWTQCDLANAELSQTSCCSSGSSSVCDVYGQLDASLTRVGHLAGPKVNGPVSPADVEVEIAARRPVGVRIGWYGSGGAAHFVVISGYDDSSGAAALDIEDPYYGPSILLDFTSFSTAYQSGAGQWTHTYPIA